MHGAARRHWRHGLGPWKPDGCSGERPGDAHSGCGWLVGGVGLGGGGDVCYKYHMCTGAPAITCPPPGSSATTPSSSTERRTPLYHGTTRQPRPSRAVTCMGMYTGRLGPLVSPPGDHQFPRVLI